MKTCDDILREATVPDGRREKTAFFSATCCWWTSGPADLGRTASGLPACPHCGSPLYEGGLKGFIAQAQRAPENYGDHGIRALEAAHAVNCQRQCHRGWDRYGPLLQEDVSA